MKYFMLAVCGLLALLSGLAFRREYAFVGPLTSWPMLCTVVAAVGLMVVRKPWKIMTAGMVLVGASVLELVGAFFSFIIVAFLCTGPGHATHAMVDVAVLVGIALLSMATSWLALGWGVWHTITTPRQVLHRRGDIVSTQ